nr:sulfotransferase family 2 domain-containing protein [Marivita sp. GX14005]
MFDNRTAIDRVGLTGLQRRIDGVRGLGRNHFALEIEGRRIGYCYIRKNACSSFKKLFLDHSPHRSRIQQNERPIDFIRRFHRLPVEELFRCDDLIFVYRDPVARVLSMFRNKFIARNGATDILAGFRRITGRDPERASFQSFVEAYLGQDPGYLDRHVQPQRMHLQRVVYTHAIPIDGLHGAMSALLGAPLADRYFLKPVNRTSNATLVHLPGGAVRPVREWQNLFDLRAEMPDDASLLSDALVARLRRIYAMDYAMLDAVKHASRCH